MRAISALAGAGLVTLVKGHGYMITPSSRTRLGAEVRGSITLISHTRIEFVANPDFYT